MSGDNRIPKGRAVLTGQRRILFLFHLYGAQLDNLTRLAEKWDTSEGGRFNTIIREATRNGLLKRMRKGENDYLKLSFKGSMKILDLLLPKILMYFILLVSVTLTLFAAPAILFHSTISPWGLLSLSAVLMVFSVAGLILLQRMQNVLLNIR